MQETLDLFAAQEQGRVGMQRAVEHADRETPHWSVSALHELRLFARIQEQPFTIEKARDHLILQPPPDGRAWGAVTQMAIRKGFIVPTHTYAKAVSSNGSPKMLYRRGQAA